MKKRILMFVYIIAILLAAKQFLNYQYNNYVLDHYNKGDYSINENLLLSLNIFETYIAHYNNGNILYQNMQFEAALQEYEKALKCWDLGEEEECSVRINMALCKIGLLDEDFSDPENIEESLELLYEARDILLENGCATDDDDGHSKKAQKLKNEIDDMIEQLENLQEQYENPPEETDPSDSSDPSDNSDPSDTSDPSETTDPSDPSESSDQSDPSETSDGSEPSDTTDSTDNPSDPSNVSGTPTPTGGAQGTGTPTPTGGAQGTGTPTPTGGAQGTGTPTPTPGGQGNGTPTPTPGGSSGNDRDTRPSPREGFENFRDFEEYIRGELSEAGEEAYRRRQNELEDYNNYDSPYTGYGRIW